MSLVQNPFVALAAAIVCEVAGTTSLQASEQFSRLWPTLAMVACYAASIALLTRTLQALPLGIAYAIWSGVGIVLTTAVGALVFRQMLDGPALVGIGMIVGGVAIMQVFSSAVPH